MLKFHWLRDPGDEPMQTEIISFVKLWRLLLIFDKYFLLLLGHLIWNRHLCGEPCRRGFQVFRVGIYIGQAEKNLTFLGIVPPYLLYMEPNFTEIC